MAEEQKKEDSREEAEGEISVAEEGKPKFSWSAFLKNKKLIVVMAALLLVLVAGMTTVSLILKTSPKKDSSVGILSSEWMGPIYPLEVIMNLKSGEDENLEYVEMNISLELDNDALLKEIESKKTKITDILLSFMGEKSSAEINSIPEQNRLKRRIKELVNAHLLSGRVVKVYFTGFKITQGSYIRKSPDLAKEKKEKSKL